MEILIRSTAAALSASAICLLIKRTNPEISLLLGLCTTVVILAAALKVSDCVSELSDTVRSMAGVSGKYISPILKCTAISITTKIGSSLCKDASQSAAALSLELVGTVCALATATPLIISMLEMIGELV